MSYRGEIKNGVVVFDEPPPFKEGTAVEVEEAAPAEPDPIPGSVEAMRRLDETTWVGPPGELERLLAEVYAMREEDLNFPDKPSPLDDR